MSEVALKVLIYHTENWRNTCFKSDSSLYIEGKPSKKAKDESLKYDNGL